jgi:hypothetical protein
MPKIPERSLRGQFEGRTRVTSAGDQALARAESAEARALAEVGAGGARLAANLLERRERTMDNDDINNRLTDYKKRSREFIRDARVNMPENGEGYSESISNGLQSLQADVMKGARSKRSREFLSDKMSAMNEDQVFSAETEQMRARSTSLRSNVVNNWDNGLETHMGGADYVAYSQDIDDLDETIQAHVGDIYTEKEGKQLFESQVDRGSRFVIERLIKEERLEEATNLLDQKGEGKKMLQFTSTEHISALKDRVARALDAKRERKGNADLFLWNSSLKATASGQGPDNRSLALQYQRLVSNPDLSETARVKATQEFEMASQLNETMKAMNTLDRGDLRATQERLFNERSNLDPTKFGVQAPMLENSIIAINREIEIRDKDSFQYVVNNNPRLAQLVASGDEVVPESPEEFQFALGEVALEQARLGAAPRIMSQQQAHEEVGRFDGMTEIQAAQNLDRLIVKYGSFADQAMSDMVKAGLPGYYKLAAQSDDINTKEAIIRIKKREKDIEERFKVTKELHGLDDNTINRVILENSDAINGAIAAAQPGSVGFKVMNELQSVIRLRVKEDASSLGKSFDANEAVESAVNEVLNANYESVTFKTSNILAPKRLDDGTPLNTEYLRRYLSFYMSFDRIGELRKPNTMMVQSGAGRAPGHVSIAPIVEPTFAQDLRQKQPSISDSEIESRWFQEVSRRGEWATNQDQTGIVLRLPDGPRFKTLIDSRGNKVEVLFKEINLTDDPRVMLGDPDLTRLPELRAL